MRDFRNSSSSSEVSCVGRHFYAEQDPEQREPRGELARRFRGRLIEVGENLRVVGVRADTQGLAKHSADRDIRRRHVVLVARGRYHSGWPCGRGDLGRQSSTPTAPVPRQDRQ